MGLRPLLPLSLVEDPAWEACVVAQQVEPPLRVLAALLLLRLPASVPVKAEEDSLRAWTPETHMRDLCEAAGSWIEPDPGLAILIIGE